MRPVLCWGEKWKQKQIWATSEYLPPHTQIQSSICVLTHAPVLTAGQAKRCVYYSIKTHPVHSLSLWPHIFSTFVQERNFLSPLCSHGSEHNPVFRLWFKDNSKNKWYVFSGYRVPNTALMFLLLFLPQGRHYYYYSVRKMMKPRSKYVTWPESQLVWQRQNLIHMWLFLAYIGYNLYFYTFLMWCSQPVYSGTRKWVLNILFA